MNSPESGAGAPAPRARQARPARKGRAGLIALILVILVVLAGGAAAYYYLLYLPATPQAVLAEYLALEEKSDYEGTYRFLSQDSRKLFPEENWKAVCQVHASMREQFTVERTVGDATRTGDRCTIPVATKTTMKPTPGQPSGSDFSSSATIPYVLVKEKTGWKVDLIEQSKELMRQHGASEKDIEQATKAMNEMIKQRDAETAK